jgi:hypothetical protein
VTLPKIGLSPVGTSGPLGIKVMHHNSKFKKNILGLRASCKILLRIHDIIILVMTFRLEMVFED